MHDDVGAKGDGLAQKGRGHRVVDDQRHAVRVGYLGKGRDVGDVGRRIADRFAENRSCLAVDQRRIGGRVGARRETHVDAELRESMREQVVGAAVERRRADDIRAILGDRLDRIGDRGLARCKGQRGEAAFKCGEALFQDVRRRIHDPRVDVAGNLQVEQVSTVLRIVECVGRGLVDRYRDGLGSRIGAVAGVNGECGEAHGGSWRRLDDQPITRRKPYARNRPSIQTGYAPITARPATPQRAARRSVML